MLPACISEPVNAIAARCSTLRETTRAKLAETRLDSNHFILFNNLY